ncbi:hypothetical protein HDU93_007695 [Gonapodya sp. JEL0774]|nr:hypothetical protein HDU93_007695 [Gonapodya sp. JEL0774]
MTDRKALFRVQDDTSIVPRIPLDVSPPHTKTLPRTRAGLLADLNIRKGYDSFFSASEDKSAFWDHYADGATTTFLGKTEHLSRYPRDSHLFWSIFYVVIGRAMADVINHPTVDVLVWDNGYAFAASHITYKTKAGTTWAGMVLNRMKYNERGLVYDQAFLAEDLPGLDALTVLNMKMDRVLKVRDIDGRTGRLPEDVSKQRHETMSERARKAERIIVGGYAAWAQGDYAGFQTIFAPESVTYFGGTFRHLSRYPRKSSQFWLAFGLVGTVGLEELVTSPKMDMLVWENGYAFGAQYAIMKLRSGNFWKGDLLDRMKYNENGQVYDQAFFAEDQITLDKVTGELFEMPEVVAALRQAETFAKAEAEEDGYRNRIIGTNYVGFWNFGENVASLLLEERERRCYDALGSLPNQNLSESAGEPFGLDDPSSRKLWTALMTSIVGLDMAAVSLSMDPSDDYLRVPGRLLNASSARAHIRDAPLPRRDNLAPEGLLRTEWILFLWILLLRILVMDMDERTAGYYVTEAK